MPPVTRSSSRDRERQRRRDQRNKNKNSNSSKKKSKKRPSHPVVNEPTVPRQRQRRRGDSSLAKLDDAATRHSSPSSTAAKAVVPTIIMKQQAVAVVARRRSGRGSSNGLRDLAQLLVSGKRIVFITGAGLSVGSGIRPFRDSSFTFLPPQQQQQLAISSVALSSSSSSSTQPNQQPSQKQKQPPPRRHVIRTTSLKPASASNAIWNSVIWTTATRETFRKNPLEWYNQFWIPQFLIHAALNDDNDNDDHEEVQSSHHEHRLPPPPPSNHPPDQQQQQQQQRPQQQSQAPRRRQQRVPRPNAGHYALHHLQQMTTTNIQLITQNVDGLHIKVEQEAAAAEKEEEEEERAARLLFLKSSLETAKTGTVCQHDDDNDDDGTAEPSLPVPTTPTPTLLLRPTPTPVCEQQPFATATRVIEAHGRLGLYKCLPDSDSDTDSDSDDDPDRSVHLGHRRKTRALRQVYQEQQLQQQQLQQQQQQQSGTNVNCTGNADMTCNGVDSSKNLHDNNNTNDDDNHHHQQPNHPQQHHKHHHQRKLCRFQFLDSLTVDQLEPPGVRSILKDPTLSSSSSLLSTPPTCPACGRLCLPQALLFDEGYHSHCFYQFEQIERMLDAAEVLVFVGTSFSVTLTQVALSHAKQHKLHVYNINPLDLLHPTSHVHNICGKAEEILPKLVDLCRQEEAAAAAAVAAESKEQAPTNHNEDESIPDEADAKDIEADATTATATTIE